MIVWGLEYICIVGGIDVGIIVGIGIGIICVVIIIFIVDIIIHSCNVWFNNVVVIERWILIIILVVRRGISGIISRGRTDKTRNLKNAGINFVLLEPFDVVYI